MSVPLGLNAGCTENSALLLFETMKFTTCADSFAGPAEMLVAHAAMLCAPAVFCVF